MPITLNDAEQAFVDSPRGQMLIARARSQHETTQAWAGANARPWTDAMAADVARTMMTREARQAVSTSAMLADSARQAPIAKAARDTALAVRKHQIANAWRNER